ncbi:hypothetical protein QPK24_04260 [Paenibacillus polygoni]|uniref:DUF4367 domain-containing protein n=1 Tax=Paenibacillus polygoni TaxID=3050112 RepID=A0ABY8X4H3_9BACL|nr:hypothetical protein [Paenibacillus polygoni]WIV19938.1 hypothetical protein QPK24_04260 [Paenibacillus polygoni]
MDIFTNENQSIRRHSVTDEEIRHISVAPRVIDQITNSTMKKKSNHRWKTVSLFLLFCVCIASVTTYAAEEFAKIYNKKGKVVVDTYPMKDRNYYSKESKRIEKLKPEAKPGELIAYFPIETDLQAYLGPTKILYEYKPIQYYDINELYKKAKSTNAPDLISPSYLSKGYTFHFATIWPKYPSAGDGEGSEYDKLLQRLSSKAIGTNEKIISETLQWSKAGSVHLYFSTKNEPNSLIVMASYGLGLQVPQPAGAISRKIKIDTQQALIMHDSSNTYFNTRIAWYDESTSTAYFMEDNANIALSEEEMVKMAGRLIHAISKKE